MRGGRFILALLLATAIGTQSVSAETKTFRTIPGDSRNLVQFVSEATLERIVGTTSSITGSVELDLSDLPETEKAGFEVDLEDIDTGIAMRNGHMRDQYLETGAFPQAMFKLSRIVSAGKPGLAYGETATLLAEGEFTLHGVSKTYQIPVTLTYTASGPETHQRLYGGDGDLLLVKADWVVKLADHGIMRPEFLLMRLAEEQKVSISIAMTNLPSARSK